MSGIFVLVSKAAFASPRTPITRVFRQYNYQRDWSAWRKASWNYRPSKNSSFKKFDSRRYSTHYCM